MFFWWFNGCTLLFTIDSECEVDGDCTQAFGPDFYCNAQSNLCQDIGPMDDVGPIDTDEPTDTDDPDDDDEDTPLPGPDPYQEGDDRLSLGIFYEGGYSDIIRIDDVNISYYIFNNYTETVDTEDRIEGYLSTAWNITETDWFGGGVTAKDVIDLSEWNTLHFSLKGQPSNTLQTLQVNVETRAGSNQVELFEEGFANDGTWHTFAIPLSVFSDDLTETSGLFILTSPAGFSEDVIKIDNLYYTAQ